MSGTQKNIDLIKDINEIAEKGIQAFELSYDESGHSNLHDPLLRWCDFVLRYIAPGRRVVLKSDRFTANVPDDAKVGLQRIEELFNSGENVNPYQSKTLTLFNDTSGKKTAKRTDNLWADWGIHHLHLPLNPVDPAEKYSDRSEWVLFLKVYNNAVFFIDIKSHDKAIEPDLFSQKDLIETFIRNWPAEAEVYEMKGVSGLATNQLISDTDIANLRKSGINLPLQIGGKVYAPLGMGVTTAVTAARVSIYRDKICAWAKKIEGIIMDENGQYMKEVKSQNIKNPKFDMYMYDGDVFGITEKHIDKGWIFTRGKPDDVFSLLFDSLMPVWASPVVIQYWKQNP
ncbi:hypothetical protein N7V53_16865 [Kosakonia sp. HypNH10]|uniref:hypothetical protein n=1 Tax=Kosakonia sp. HypNH10 TaxID=2980101 RepID=UPI00244C825C|nr:hypothetical protein [Kosakonia sp. HypNH10]MDH2914180.1 hypothetical protein [Kosakonia sp. HypNH10]